ncbi:MAG: ATP-binding cassette domain-containing protein [Bdellovibrionota bacterium]
MLFQINSLSFSYPGNTSPVLAVDSFELREAERVFVQGRSGSGKSTFLNLLAGVLLSPPNTIFYKGQDYSMLKPAQRDRLRASDMGIVFQQFNLLPFLSAEENVLLPFLFIKQDTLIASLRERAAELFAHLKLTKSQLEKPVYELSVGQQQRVAVVRALIHKPKLILADEPTSSLDTEVRDDFIRLLLQESETIGAAVVFVSHDPGLERHFTKTLHLKQVKQQ